MPSDAKIGLNHTTQQYYIRDVGYVSLSSLRTFTRSGTATAIDSAGLVTSFAADTPALADTGLWDTWESRRNLLLNTGDLSNASWATFINGTGSLSKVANAGTAPDGSNNATKFTINRTTTVSYAIVDQSFTGTAAGYSGSIWLKADAGNAGRVIYIALSNGTAPQNPQPVTLTNTWTRYSVQNVTLAASANCQLVIGYITGVGGVGGTAFLAWGGQAELGPTVSPYMPNAGTSVARGAATWTATGALATLLASSTASVEFVTYSSDRGGVAKTLIDANGSVLLGVTSGNLATSAVGAALNTSNVGVWTTTNDLGFSWNASGGLFNLIGTQTSDATARTPTGPFKFFNTGGANYWNGQIGIELYYDTKQTSLQAVLPSGVLPGFINKYAGSPLPGISQYRNFSGLVPANSSNPLFTQNAGTWDTFGTNTPYMTEGAKSGSTYYALTSTAVNNGSGGQNWINMALYTGTSPLNFTAHASNPSFTNTAGAWDDNYLLHPCITRDCALAPFVAYYSARNAAQTAWGIGIATSTDGVTWTKYASNPIITWNAGQGYANPGLPTIVTVGSTLYLIVCNNGNASTNFQLFSSPTSSGTFWTRVGTILPAPVAGDPDFGATGIIDPWVIQNKHGFFEMTYTAYFGTYQQVCYAVTDSITTPFVRYPYVIQSALHLTFTGDPVQFENSSAHYFIWDEDNGTNTSQPYASTLPPY
jgi:hypothetical protein